LRVLEHHVNLQEDDMKRPDNIDRDKMSCPDKVQLAVGALFLAVIAPPMVALCVWFAMTGNWR